ncbi:MAG: copper homeostasis protein CutC [Bacteroidota bacterium]
MLIEICASNIQSALIAEQAGGQRIELCSGLDGGGVTPSYGLIRAACKQLTIPVNVLIRPREGNFVYDATELDMMCEDIRFCKSAGANGVVIGALDANGNLALDQMQQMIEAAEGMDVCCHRAFDYTSDPFEALEQLIALRVNRILSSGQATDAYQGRELLREIVQKAAGRISIMPGAGISFKNIKEIAEVTQAQEFHFTGRKKVVQPNPGGDIPGLEWWYWESSADVIRQTIAALNQD